MRRNLLLKARISRLGLGDKPRQQAFDPFLTGSMAPRAQRTRSSFNVMFTGRLTAPRS